MSTSPKQPLGSPLSFTQIADYDSSKYKSTILSMATAHWAIVLAYNYDVLDLQKSTESDIQAVYDTLQKEANVWIDQVYGNATKKNTVVGIVASIQNIASNHPTSAQGISEMLQQITEALDGGKSVTSDEVKGLLSGINSTLQSMQADITSASTNAGSIESSISTYLTNQKTAESSLEALDKKYLGKAGADATKITQLQSNITAQQAIVKSTMDQYHKYCIAAETAPAYLIIPFVGPFIAVADATTFAILAANELKEADDAKNTIASDHTQIAQLQAQSAAIKQAVDQNKNIIAAMDVIVSAVEEIKGIFGDYAAQLSSLQSDITTALKGSNPSATIGEIYQDVYSALPVVEKAWQTVYDASKSFVITSSITPPKQASNTAGVGAGN